MFEHHPKTRKLAEALGTSGFTVRRLVRAGVVRTVLFTDGEHIHKEDANRLIADGMTPEEKSKYSALLRAEKSRKAIA